MFLTIIKNMGGNHLSNSVLKEKSYNQFQADLHSVNTCFQFKINRSENFVLKYSYNIVLILKLNNSLCCCVCEKWKNGGMNLGCIFVRIIKYSFESEKKQISNIIIGKLPDNCSIIDIKIINLEQF